MRQYQVKARKLGNSQIVSVPKPYRVKNGSFGDVKYKQDNKHVYITYRFDKSESHYNIFASKKWRTADFTKIYKDAGVPLDHKPIGDEKW